MEVEEASTVVVPSSEHRPINKDLKLVLIQLVEYLSLWRDDDDSYCVAIKSDEQLHEWFQLNIESGVVPTYCQINNFEGPLQFSPTKRRFHPKVRNKLHINEGDTSKPATPTKERAPSKLATPTKERAPSKSGTKKRVKKSKRKGGDDEEPIGVDDEGIYDETEVLSDSSYDSDLATSSDSDDGEYDPDDEIVDEVDEDDIPAFSYDVDNPCIDVGVI
ncbi:hypothetical protein EJB05_37358, partial [Eragrostis curvula]